MESDVSRDDRVDEMAPLPKSATGYRQSGPPPAAPRRRRAAPQLPSWRIVFCHWALFAMVVVYFNLLFAASVWLGITADHLLLADWGPGQSVPFRILGLLLIAGLLCQFVCHIWQGILALVTARQDDSPEVEGEPLDPKRHPELYDLVAEVGRAVASPLPDTIRVTHQPQCFVAEVRRFALSTNRRLILVLGLPHLAVLSADELRVLLAHELAHFRCGDTTLGVFIYRFLEFLRRCGDRMRRRWWNWFSPIYWLARGYLFLGMALWAPILRQQELQADRLSAAAYGGALAADTLLKEWLLARQFDVAVAEYAQQHPAPAGGASETVFQYFARRWRPFSNAGRVYLQRRLAEEERLSLFDSHPTIQARIEAMGDFQAQEPVAAVERDQAPPWDLAELEQRLHDRVFQRVA